MGLAAFHPRLLFAYFMLQAGLTVFFPHPAATVLSFLGAAAAGIATDRGFAKRLPFSAVLVVTAAVTNPLFSHRGVTVLFYAGRNPVTLESSVYGLFFGLAMAATLLWFGLFGRIFDTEKLLCVFGSRFPRFALAMTLVFRFVPLFKRQIRRYFDGCKVSGLYAGNRTRDKIAAGAAVFSAMFSWCMEHGIETAAAMEAKGFGLPGRTSYSLYVFGSRDRGLGALAALGACGFAAAAAADGMTHAFYPRFEFAVDSQTVLGLCFFAFLSFLPFLIEIKENLRWKRFVSNM